MDRSTSSLPSRPQRLPSGFLEHRLAGTVGAALAVAVLVATAASVLPPPRQGTRAAASDADAALAAAALAGEFSVLNAEAPGHDGAAAGVRKGRTEAPAKSLQARQAGAAAPGAAAPDAHAPAAAQ